MRQVVLLDAKTGNPLVTTQSNFLGKFTFSGLPAGQYLLDTHLVKLPATVINESVRVDIDLSRPDGTMDYAADGIAEGSSSATEAPTGPNDSTLQSQIAGIWWGYAGSTEKKLGLCPDGTYQDYSESSYSGRSFNSAGNETMEWGDANQRGNAGRWTIQGDTERGTIHVTTATRNSFSWEYRQIGDPGCLSFSGHTLCRTQATCQ